MSAWCSGYWRTRDLRLRRLQFWLLGCPWHMPGIMGHLDEMIEYEMKEPRT